MVVWKFRKFQNASKKFLEGKVVNRRSTLFLVRVALGNKHSGNPGGCSGQEGLCIRRSVGYVGTVQKTSGIS